MFQSFLATAPRRWAGHSKWANIRHKKAATDAKRMRIFTRISKLITVAAKSELLVSSSLAARSVMRMWSIRTDGTDTEVNRELANALEQARMANVPKDLVENAMKKGTDVNTANWENVTYEGVGPGGCTVMLECLTDNRKKTAPEIRHIFSKSGGQLGADGSAAFNFVTRGEVEIGTEGPAADEDDALALAMEGGADDVEWEDLGADADAGTPRHIARLVCIPESLDMVKEAVRSSRFSMLSAEVTKRPTSTIELAEDKAEEFQRFLDRLDEHNDVQNVYHNVAI